MIFECFYYPKLNSVGEVVRCNEDLVEFNFGDTVPSKTLYYNYSSKFAIYQGGEFFVVDNSVLTKSIKVDELKYPLNLVFNKGTQLTISSPKELPSIRLLIKGENEVEKELGDLFFLSIVLNRKIKNIQYKVMSDLTNCSRDYQYVNQELDLRTKHLLDDLKNVENKFYNLNLDHPHIKDDYLSYMNFSNKEDILELSINKYFKEDTEEYREHTLKSLVWKSKPIFPKFKLDNLINSFNYRI